MASNDLTDLITAAIANSGDEALVESKSKEIAQKITSRESTLLGLVENLGPQLTSTTVLDRVKAVDILARVFSTLPKDFLTEKELEFIVEFLCNRLKDQHLVIPKAILCCYPIVQCQNLPRGAGAQLLHQIFQEANVQSHVHKIRRTVFEIIEFLIRHRIEELKELSSDFVVNFLQAMDGEKDPRNLLLLFQMMPHVISTFDLGPFLEDFFEILSCYFPIDFSPTVSLGGTVITREVLASALHTCLSHTNKFSPFLIPLAMEKLDSSLIDSKLDSLRLLELCCEKCYQPGNLQPFLAQMWHSLRREIFMGGNESVEKQCITLIQSVFKVVSRDDGVLNTCIELIFTECKHHLCEPELRLIHPTSRILIGMCNASEKSCRAVAPLILQVLHDQLTRTSVQGEKKRIMEIAELILSTCRQYPEVALVELVDKWDEMLGAWFSFITNDDSEFANLSLKILLRVLENEADFPQKDRFLLQEHLLALLKCNSLSDGALATTIKIAETLVAKHGDEFSENCVNKLLSSMSQQGECLDDGNEMGSPCAKVLAECAPHNATVLEKVVSSLLTQISSSSFSREGEIPQSLKCLNRVVEKVNEFSPNFEQVASLNSILVVRLAVFDKIFQLVLEIAKTMRAGGGGIDMLNQQTEMNGMEVETTTKDLDIFNICVRIVRNLVRSSGEVVQQDLVDRFWKQNVLEADWESFLDGFPFQLVEAILGGLRPKIEIYRKAEFAEYLLQKSVQPTPHNGHPYQRLLSVFVNKLEPEADFESLLKRVETVIFENLVKISSSIRFPESSSSCGESPMEVDDTDGEIDGKLTEDESSRSCCATSLLTWITKGLAMRGIQDLSTWLGRLINLLNSNIVGTVAADGFGILLCDDEVSLNPKSHCKFRFLYKQRLFQTSVPRLVTGYRGSKSNMAKANFIKALSCQLKHIPSSILGMEMESVFPLLVASLKLDTSAPLVSSTLKAFTEMLQNSDEETDKKLIEYCYDIVPQLVKLAGFPGNMEVRCMALQCLLKCAKCPSHVVLPLRAKVIDDLGQCVDDHKRLVRKEARTARNAWILLGAAGGS
ncbi:MMS19 nucleotide excision repair protein homolog isoform X2 [Folsomia candida]|uniref:MMS19 nucleotide excision repair protein homolog isoform X2 n=1 Tax=Folsomia candida TaxID=158441 RepID=UPI000B8F7D90|nr:MMS19 nucleotide excision repair protein homolog isoform X2 [Folsomia candida]